MTNSRKCCRFCKEYKLTEDMIKLPSGHACDMDCIQGVITKDREKKREQALKQQEWQKKQDKKIDLKVKKMKREFRANDIKLRKKTAQTAFNKYIRVRDKGFDCISCDKPDDGSHQIHASHYRSVGACSALRFNELNVHASCAQCNSMKSGNISEYRIRLIKKIGIDSVEWLESQNQVVRYTADEYKKVETEYKQKLKDLL